MARYGAACTGIVVCVLLCVRLLRAPDAVGSAFYISTPNTSRHRATVAWLKAENVAGGNTHHVPSTFVSEEHASMTRGAAGCRLSHIDALTRVVTSGSAWNLVVEDDVAGSYGHALRWIWRIQTVAPNVGAINLYSPKGMLRPWMSFRTTAYFVTPSGAARLLAVIRANPRVPVDQSWIPGRCTWLTWATTVLFHTWTVPHGLGVTGAQSTIDI